MDCRWPKSEAMTIRRGGRESYLHSREGSKRSMAQHQRIGWLFSLSSKSGRRSNWEGTDCFHQYLEDDNDPILIESTVWGRMKRKEFEPASGDGIALYHSTGAAFPPDDPYAGKARISVIGTLTDMDFEGVNIKWLSMSVSRRDLQALVKFPIVRDDSTRELFERCGITSGFPASLYKAGRQEWSEILLLLAKHRQQRTDRLARRSRT